MSRDEAIENWLESMSKSELIDQCFLWHDMALDQGRMYNAIKDENTKLRELARQALQIIDRLNVVMAIDWSRYSTVMSMARELEIERCQNDRL